MSAVQDTDRRKGGRPAAGTDPAKRRQIREGAERVFTAAGFEAASMSDIARAADVSKATLYVYFSSKEQLFADICAERRDRNISDLIALLDRSRPVEDVLFAVGTEGVRRLIAPQVFASHRIVIGVAERMPEIGRELYKAGSQRLGEELAAFLAHHVAAGRLDIADEKLASAQFLELSQATIFRRNMYAAGSDDITEEKIAYIVHSAVRVFMAAYAPRTNTGNSHRQAGDL